MEDLIKNQFNSSTLINPVFKYGDNEIPKFIGIPVFLPNVFIGRSNDLENIHQKLFEGDNLLLLVNGEGGIGKTALAAYYYNKYADQYSHLAWIFAEKSLPDALLTLALPLEVCFPDQSSEDERLDLLLQAMRQLRKPCLLVIDNVNDLAELEKYYNALRSCPNFHLLLTTRITEFEQAVTYPIEALSDAKVMELFKKYYPEYLESEDELLRKLLVAVGKNTLIIELLAKNLHNLNQLETCYSLSNLLEDLKVKGLFGLPGKVVSTDWHAKGNALRKERPEDIISALYDLSNLIDEERQLLSVFAVLPAENISFAQLKTLLPETEQLDDNLLLLAQKGWLGYNKELKSFKVSPVVQEITHAKNTDLVADCQQLISNLIDKLDYEGSIGHLLNVTYPEAIVYSQYAESVLHHLSQADENLAVLCERIGNFHNTTGNLDKALTFYHDEKALFEELYEVYPQNGSFKSGLAISYEKLGETHTKLGDLDKALTFYQNETTLFEELYKAYPQNVDFKNNLAISYSKLGDTHTSFGNLDKALTFYENYLQLRKALYMAWPLNVSFKNGLAISYEKLGEMHTSLGNLDKALTFYLNETTLFEELYEAYPQSNSFKNGLAISYEKLGDTHTKLGNLDKALTFYQDGTALFEELYGVWPQNVSVKNGLAISYQKLGNTHTSLGNLDKALTFYQDETALFEELYEAYPQNVSFKNGLAISYSKLGDTHTKLGNLDKALTFHQDFASLTKELYEAYPQNVSFKNGLAVSYSKLGETHTALGNLDKALTFFENYFQLRKELYEAWRQNVSFKNGLAISYTKLAVFYRNHLSDPNSARTLFRKAEKLWSELVADFPQYVEFSRNLNYVREELGE